MNFWSLLLSAIVTTLLGFIIGITYMGIRRKIVAHAQNRYGPPITQNFLDIIKFWSKESNIYHGLMHHLAPLWMIAMAITILLIVPTAYGSKFFTNLTFNGDLILILYLMPFGQLGMALGVGQTGNPNSAIGVTRGLSLMVGSEIPFIMALIAVMLQYHTTSVTDLVRIQQETGTWIMFKSPFAFLAALLVLPAMFHVGPYEVIVAPAELASGPMSEFGGKYLGTMMSAGSIFMFAKYTLFVDVFMGGASNWLWLIVKTFVVFLFIVFIGIIMPRLRTEQAIRRLWGWPLAFAILAFIQVAFF